MKLYKSMRKGLKSNYDNSQWKIGEWRKTECSKLCVGFNCSENIIDAMQYVDMEILAEVKTKGKVFKGDYKQTSEEMMIVKAWKWEKKDSVALAIYVAELVIDIFEKEYPNDKRPRNAIEAAKNYLKNPSDAVSNAAWAAAKAAKTASNAAWVVSDAARAASDAARAASDAAWTAWAASDAGWTVSDAARAASDAAWTAWAAARAVRAAAWAVSAAVRAAASDAILIKCQKWIIKHIKELEEIKK